jgi:6,7-dimethyl-8-ribityllumazine synthase
MSDRTFDDDRDRFGDRPGSTPPPFEESGSGVDDVESDDEPSLERAAENVLDAWPTPVLEDFAADEADSAEGQGPQPTATSSWSDAQGSTPDETVIVRAPAPEPETSEPDSSEPDSSEPEPPAGGWEEEPSSDESAEPEEATELPDGSVESVMGSSEHAPGELQIPTGVPVLEGEPRGERRAVGIVVSRFNGNVTSKLLESALAELELRGVERTSITVMPVPGAFELPIAAMALAKTRRFACILALGCVIRGDTPHFEYVSSEAASGLQLAAIETGVPVAFGVLTLDRSDQAEARYEKGAEAVRTGLEMADVFANLRAAAAR